MIKLRIEFPNLRPCEAGSIGSELGADFNPCIERKIVLELPNPRPLKGSIAYASINFSSLYPEIQNFKHA